MRSYVFNSPNRNETDFKDKNKIIYKSDNFLELQTFAHWLMLPTSVLLVQSSHQGICKFKNTTSTLKYLLLLHINLSFSLNQKGHLTFCLQKGEVPFPRLTLHIQPLHIDNQNKILDEFATKLIYWMVDLKTLNLFDKKQVGWILVGFVSPLVAQNWLQSLDIVPKLYIIMR